MRRLLLVFLFAGVLAAQQASLEGTAIDALTRQPLSGVHVSLVAVVMGGVTGTYGALSDRAGHFSFAIVRPGTYILLCERSGYLHVQAKDAGIPNIMLRPGQQIKDQKVEMTPRAVLSGRVIDENGDPMQGVRVETVALPPELVSLMQGGQSGQGTDDRGEFRIIVAPGKFYLRAWGGSSGDPVEHRADGSTLPPYSPTFYPSTPVKSRAIAVEAVGAKETAGLEIRLTRQQGISISGIVRDRK